MEQGENVERGPVDLVRSGPQRASERKLVVFARELPASADGVLVHAREVPAWMCELLAAPEVAAPHVAARRVAAPEVGKQRPSDHAGAEAA